MDMRLAFMLMIAAEACGDPAQPRRIQALFPARKVFSSRFECDGDVENNVKYTNTDAKRAFIAVYAGASAGDAQALLAQAKAKGFADANVRRMQVVLVHP